MLILCLTMKLSHKFIKTIPDELEDCVIYISLEYGTAMHNCCCGCGRKVVTPLSSYDWQMLFDGDTISLYPSIGNWNFPCQSHYWIINSEIEWAPRWTKRQIKEVQENEQRPREERKKANPFSIFEWFSKRKRHR